MINEQEAYQQYVASCNSVPGQFVSEFRFEEWRLMGRPKGLWVKDGYWPTPWPTEEKK